MGGAVAEWRHLPQPSLPRLLIPNTCVQSSRLPSGCPLQIALQRGAAEGRRPTRHVTASVEGQQLWMARGAELPKEVFLHTWYLANSGLSPGSDRQRTCPNISIPDCPRLLSLDLTTPQSNLHLFCQDILAPEEYALHLAVCTCLHLPPPSVSVPCCQLEPFFCL